MTHFHGTAYDGLHVLFVAAARVPRPEAQLYPFAAGYRRIDRARIHSIRRTAGIIVTRRLFIHYRFFDIGNALILRQVEHVVLNRCASAVRSAGKGKNLYVPGSESPNRVSQDAVSIFGIPAVPST